MRHHTRGGCVDGGVAFHWRPWMVLPRRSLRFTDVELVVEHGVLTPTLVHVGDDRAELTLARLPPRYRTHGVAIATTLGGLRTREPLLVRGWQAFKGSLREQLGRARGALQG